MIGRSLKTSFYTIIILSGLGCASFKNIQSSRFKSSSLSDLNPAPKNMAPPEGQGTEDQMVDPLYLRTQADYHYTMGEALSMEGSIDEAIEQFKLTIVYDPNSAVVRKRLAEEYVKKGLLSEGIEQTELALKNDPEYVDGYILLGQLYQTLKMHTQAKEQYLKILELDPQNIQGTILIGSLLAEQEKYDESESYFQKLAKNPNNKKQYLSYYYIGSIRIKQGGMKNLRKAEKAFMKGLSIKPDSEDLVMGLAQLYELEGNQPKAVKLVESYQDKFGPVRGAASYLSQIYLEQEDYDKAVKQLEILEGYSSDNINIKVKLALILIEKKKFKEAIPKLEEIIAIAPESDKIRFYLGAVYEELKNIDLAIFHFSKISETSTYYSDAVIHVAYLHKDRGDIDSAISAIKLGIAAKSQTAQFYAFYASLLDEKREYKTAIKMLRKAVVQFPSNTQLRFFLGSMNDRLGNTEVTISEMRKVLDIDKDHVQALNYLAYTYAELNERLGEAEGLAKRALELKPNDGYIMDTLGWIYFKKGNQKEAIKYLEAAYKAKDGESIVAEHLGDAYYRYELLDKAKAMYMKAVSIERDKKKLQSIQKKLSNVESILDDSRSPASQGR